MGVVLLMRIPGIKAGAVAAAGGTVSAARWWPVTIRADRIRGVALTAATDGSDDWFR
jgi:hypothetical protein